MVLEPLSSYKQVLIATSPIVHGYRKSSSTDEAKLSSFTINSTFANSVQVPLENMNFTIKLDFLNFLHWQE